MQDDHPEFLYKLPADYFISLCNHKDLNVPNEALVAKFIQSYLKHRTEDPKIPELEEDDPFHGWKEVKL